MARVGTVEPKKKYDCPSDETNTTSCSVFLDLEGVGRSRGVPGWQKKNILDRYAIHIVEGVEVIVGRFSNKRIVRQSEAEGILWRFHDDAGHPGRATVMSTIKQIYHSFPRIYVDQYLASCNVCASRRPIPKLPVGKPIQATGVMVRIQADLIDCRSCADGGIQWILQVKDHFSKFVWLFCLERKESQLVVTCLRQIFQVFGPPRILQTDNGGEFCGSKMDDLLAEFPCIKMIHGSARHPQSQGLVERANQTLENRLGAWIQQHGPDGWSSAIPKLAFEINRSPSRVIGGSTPFELMFARTARDPLEGEPIDDAEIVFVPFGDDEPGPGVAGFGAGAAGFSGLGPAEPGPGVAGAGAGAAGFSSLGPAEPGPGVAGAGAGAAGFSSLGPAEPGPGVAGFGAGAAGFSGLGPVEPGPGVAGAGAGAAGFSGLGPAEPGPGVAGFGAGAAGFSGLGPAEPGPGVAGFGAGAAGFSGLGPAEPGPGVAGAGAGAAGFSGLGPAEPGPGVAGFGAGAAGFSGLGPAEPGPGVAGAGAGAAGFSGLGPAEPGPGVAGAGAGAAGFLGLGPAEPGPGVAGAGAGAAGFPGLEPFRAIAVPSLTDLKPSKPVLLYEINPARGIAIAKARLQPTVHGSPVKTTESAFEIIELLVDNPPIAGPFDEPLAIGTMVKWPKSMSAGELGATSQDVKMRMAPYLAYQNNRTDQGMRYQRELLKRPAVQEGDVIAVKIPRADRAILDPLNLPAKVLDNKNGFLSLQVGSSAVKTKVLAAQVSPWPASSNPPQFPELDPTSTISKVGALRSTTTYGRKTGRSVCQCKKGCTKSCGCKKSGIGCGTKCHPGSACNNV